MTMVSVQNGALQEGAAHLLERIICRVIADLLDPRGSHYKDGHIVLKAADIPGGFRNGTS
jgi:hypothetical protein